jgi:DNA-binding Xre family transcriptional regulator
MPILIIVISKINTIFTQTIKNNHMFKEALLNYCKKTGKKESQVKGLISKKIYGENLHYVTRINNINNLFNGKKTNIPIEHLISICEILEISPNELLGFKQNEDESKKKIQQIREIIS